MGPVTAGQAFRWKSKAKAGKGSQDTRGQDKCMTCTQRKLAPGTHTPVFWAGRTFTPPLLCWPHILLEVNRKEGARRWWRTPLIPALGGKVRRFSLSSRPAWSKKASSRIYAKTRDPVSKKKKKKKRKTKEKKRRDIHLSKGEG